MNVFELQTNAFSTVSAGAWINLQFFPRHNQSNVQMVQPLNEMTLLGLK